MTDHWPSCLLTCNFFHCLWLLILIISSFVTAFIKAMRLYSNCAFFCRCEWKKREFRTENNKSSLVKCSTYSFASCGIITLLIKSKFTWHTRIKINQQIFVLVWSKPYIQNVCKHISQTKIVPKWDLKNHTQIMFHIYFQLDSNEPMHSRHAPKFHYFASHPHCCSTKSPI